MSQLGDFAEDAMLHFLWSTNDGDGASITRATDGVVSVYKDNLVDQSTVGITDTEDFDGLTGVHLCTIDLSADAFYATGADYSVVLSAATIDGQTVNAVLATFSIENRFMRGTDAAATAADLSTHDGKLDTAQTDLDTITGSDGSTLATAQGNYAPSKAGDSMNLAADAIKAVSYDESTAFPVKSDDTGATQIARTGADGDTLEDLSDEIALQATAAALATVDANVDLILADTGTDGVVISSTTANQIADALLDRTNGVETSYTLRQALRLVLAACAGKLSGAATTTNTIRDVGDAKNRIVATVDADGNRSDVTLDVS